MDTSAMNEARVETIAIAYVYFTRLQASLFFDLIQSCCCFNNVFMFLVLKIVQKKVGERNQKTKFLII